MAPKKKKDEAAAPAVNVEEVQLRIAQLTDQISRVKDNIEARAKDYADSLSTFDVPYPLSCLAMSDGVLYAGSLDKRLLGIDATAHTEQLQVVAEAAVFCLEVFSEPAVLWAGTETGLIQSWNCQNSQALGELSGHTARVSKLKSTHAEKKLWSSSHDGTVREWDVQSRSCLNIYKVCEYQVGAFELSSSTLYAASWDAGIREIDLNSGECTALYKGHEHIIHAMTALDDCTFLYTASGDHKAIQWNTAASGGTFDRRATMVYKGHIDSVLCVHVLVLEDFINQISCDADGEAAAGEEAGRVSQEDLETLRDPCMPAVIVITGSDDRSIRLFDGETGACLLVLIGHTDAVASFWVEDGVLYSASYDHSIRSWQLHEALIRIQMRRTLKIYEAEKLEKEALLESSGKKKKGKKKKKK